MRLQPATIICDAARSRATQPASSQAGDWHDVTGHHRWHGDVSLRWVLTHMVEEYARHNGHADLLRERIDGRVGQ